MIALLTGCDRSPAPLAIAGAGPAFDPIAFFSGHTRSWGVMESRSGTPTQAVMTDSQGVIDDQGRLQMTQTLTYQSGASEKRVWTLSRTSQDRYAATANDMIGTADGRADGPVFHWQWVLAHSPGNPLMNVTMHQWMYRLPDSTVLIRTTVSKLGIILMEVTEQFSHGGTGAVARRG